MITILSRLFRIILKLPPAQTYDVLVERDLPVPMRDGTVLLADHYYSEQTRKAPTLLVRSPYGRAGVFGYLFGRIFAERGFQVVVQSCRGTFGSGGEFNAFRNEQADGTDTLTWLQAQPWFAGPLATVGPSYLGLTQWAIAAGGLLKAMGLLITSSEFRTLVYPGESFGLDTALTWIQGTTHQEESFWQRLLTTKQRAKELQQASMHLPLCETDQIAAGKRIGFYQDWLVHNCPDDPWWQAVDFSASTASLSADTLLIGGWYDIFLPHILADYTRLRQNGACPYLTIGPWTHTPSPTVLSVMLNESLTWFRTHLLGEQGALRQLPVRIFVMGRNQWREFPDWPPVGYAPQRWYLQAGNALAPQAPTTDSQPDHYRYDPADPTPSVGGSSLSTNSGAKDNRTVEARKDVLLYTTPVLERDVEVIGALRAELFVQSSLEHTDFFVRLCDVDSSGKSINISDGLLRLQPGQPSIGEDGVWQINVELWATAHCFKKGHRIRVQVAGGSHPRYVRNLGSGEPLATATTLIAAEHTVYHDAQHPSAILLPVKQ
ncbi:MAG: CocE/NonD family hydrolase [Caldilineaceae bacterium]